MMLALALSPCANLARRGIRFDVGDILASATGTLGTVPADLRPASTASVTDAMGATWTINATTGAVTASLSPYSGIISGLTAPVFGVTWTAADGRLVRLVASVIGTLAGLARINLAPAQDQLAGDLAGPIPPLTAIAAASATPELAAYETGPASDITTTIVAATTDYLARNADADGALLYVRAPSGPGYIIVRRESATVFRASLEDATGARWSTTIDLAGEAASWATARWMRAVINTSASRAVAEMLIENHAGNRITRTLSITGWVPFALGPVAIIGDDLTGIRQLSRTIPLEARELGLSALIRSEGGGAVSFYSPSAGGGARFHSSEILTNAGLITLLTGLPAASGSAGKDATALRAEITTAGGLYGGDRTEPLFVSARPGIVADAADAVTAITSATVVDPGGTVSTGTVTGAAGSEQIGLRLNGPAALITSPAVLTLGYATARGVAASLQYDLEAKAALPFFADPALVPLIAEGRPGIIREPHRLRDPLGGLTTPVSETPGAWHRTGTPANLRTPVVGPLAGCRRCNIFTDANFQRLGLRGMWPASTTEIYRSSFVVRPLGTCDRFATWINFTNGGSNSGLITQDFSGTKITTPAAQNNETGITLIDHRVTEITTTNWPDFPETGWRRVEVEWSVRQEVFDANALTGLPLEMTVGINGYVGSVGQTVNGIGLIQGAVARIVPLAPVSIFARSGWEALP